MTDFLGKRDGWWHYVRRVPAAYAAHDKRGIVKQSTKIRVADDPRGIAASKAAAKINAETEAYWRGLFLGRGDQAKQRYEAARQFTRAMGFEPVPAAELIDRSDDEIARRLLAIQRRGFLPNSEAPDAVLGLVAPPELKLSELLDKYEGTQKATLAGKSEDQLRVWRNAKARAITVLTEVVSADPALGEDPAVGKLTRSHALDFREYWQELVSADEVEIDTANKAIGHLNKMWRELNRIERMGLNPIFAELRLEGGSSEQRAAFEAAFVQETLLAAGTFGELNDEARRIVYIMADTGLRPSEICNLTKDTIRLDHKVPHVEILPEGRQTKTRDSRRTIPLVGVALAAMKEQPQGFPRYRHNAGALSALVNRMLTDKKLRPTPRHTLYSLRHCFEDRLTAIEAPEKIMAILMGHKYSRPRYGAGPTLEQKRHWLQRIAFKAPADV
ncbi:MAG: tyrosine-type recombinase/integrase [Bosea sp.]|uniref:tyrosine-type recombinase/integrase n=1 Tax=Bosea sp. (in: a-proteobacteria) TaxID=1871050 RepID=UPI00239C337C|nr:tyrosine-type recombinase/integrase [Bosea sp. (in: a-proteobacteria)]MCP4738498.1 tyrosine-type recombinase/integrase [Bosea sp. (in: a-proteobacteria)]